MLIRNSILQIQSISSAPANLFQSWWHRIPKKSVNKTTRNTDKTTLKQLNVDEELRMKTSLYRLRTYRQPQQTYSQNYNKASQCCLRAQDDNSALQTQSISSALATYSRVGSMELRKICTKNSKGYRQNYNKAIQCCLRAQDENSALQTKSISSAKTSRYLKTIYLVIINFI